MNIVTEPDDWDALFEALMNFKPSETEEGSRLFAKAPEARVPDKDEVILTADFNMKEPKE